MERIFLKVLLPKNNNSHKVITPNVQQPRSHNTECTTAEYNEYDKKATMSTRKKISFMMSGLKKIRIQTMDLSSGWEFSRFE